MAEVTYRNRLFFEVKQTRYALTTFKLAENLEDNTALDEQEAFTALYCNQRSKQLLARFRRSNKEQYSRYNTTTHRLERGGNVRGQTSTILSRVTLV